MEVLTINSARAKASSLRLSLLCLFSGRVSGGSASTRVSDTGYGRCQMLMGIFTGGLLWGDDAWIVELSKNFKMVVLGVGELIGRDDSHPAFGFNKFSPFS